MRRAAGQRNDGRPSAAVVREVGESLDRSKSICVTVLPMRAIRRVHRPPRPARAPGRRSASSPATCAGRGTPRPRTSSPRSTPSCGSRRAATRSGCSAPSAATGSPSSPPTRASSPGSARPRADLAAVPDRRPLVPAAGRRRRPAPRGDRLLLPGVRHHRGAAAVLRRPRHPGRRPPQGRQRPRRADHRRRPALPARLLPAVAVPRRLAAGDLPGPRPRRPAALAAARGRRRRAPRSRSGCPTGPPLVARRSGWPGRPRPAAAARLRRRGEPPSTTRRHRPALRRQHRAPAAPGDAARHRRRAGAPRLLPAHRRTRRPRCSTPTRATPASSASSGSASSPSPRTARARLRRGPRGRPRRHRLHHAHPGAGRHRPLPADLVEQYFGGENGATPGVPSTRILALGAEDYDGGDPASSTWP